MNGLQYTESIIGTRLRVLDMIAEDLDMQVLRGRRSEVESSVVFDRIGAHVLLLDDIRSELDELHEYLKEQLAKQSLKPIR